MCQSAVMKLRQIHSLRKTDFYHTVFLKVEGRMNWINISKEKIFAMFPQDRKYNTAFQTEKAGAQKETPMVLLCTSLCLCLSSIL